MDHFNLLWVFRHENINVPIKRVTVISGTDDLGNTEGLAAHIVKGEKIIEIRKLPILG